MFKSTKHLLVLVVLSFVFTQPLYAIDPCDTTLRLWLKAETLTSSLHQGDAVTQWTDSSSYRTTFQPRAGQNEDPHFGQVFIPGHPIPVPVVQFTINGTNGSMRDRLWQTNNLSPNFDPLDIGNGTSLSAFIVWYPVSTDETFGIQNVFGKRGASSSVYTLGMHTINDTNKGKMNYVTYDAQVEYMNSQATAATKWHVTELSIVENGANDTVTWYDDTSEIATGTMASTGSAAIASRNASTTEAFGIGTHSQPGVGTGESFYGYIAEVIIYARDITGTEKTAIEGYLHNKYFSTSVVSASDATLRLWLKADDLTHTLKPGDAVTQWTDKSSYGTILAPRSGRSEDPHYAEVYIPGNNYPVPAIEFDVDATNRDRLFQTNNLGTGDPLNIGNGSDLTAFVVYWPRFNDATIGVQTIFGKRGETSSVYTMGIINDGTGRLDYITYDAQTLYYNNRSTAAKTWHIGELRVKENGSTDTVTWFDDDTQNVGLRMVDTGSATILGRNASTTEAFGIGGHSQPCCGDGESFDGYVAEIIIFARDVTGDEREAIEKYLHEKYLGAYGSTMVDMATQSTWLKDKFTGPSPAVPFSFTYNGAASSSFLSSWTLTRTCAFLDPNRTQWTMKWINPSVPNGLQVICNVTDYKKYPAAEWLPSFTNLNSSSATYVLSNVQSLNMDMTSTCSGTPPTAQSWDAKTAWGSAPPNPNGQWSYKHGWVGNWANCPTYTADTNYQKWKTANTLPWIGKKLKTPYKDRLVMRANTGFTGGSPGPGSCPAIVWTCPATGIYNITGTLQKIASGGDGVEWVIHDGYWTIWASGLFNDTVNHPFTLNGQLIGKGETFYLTFNSRATTTYDETAVDFTFTQVSRAPWAGDFKLHFPKGSDATYMDFEPVDWGLVPSTSYTLKAWGGRSSDTRAVPFFNIEQTDTIGHIVGIGWTGQWKATFTRNSSSNLNLQAGIEDLNAKLNASESIRSAAILLSFWDGNYEQGTSEFRRLLREHYSPTPDGAKVDPPVASSVHGTYGFEATTETNLVDHTDKTATNGLLVDYLWLDAGWYTCPNNNWAEGVGNWDPDPTRFPNGLAPVSSHMHSHGFDFLMWFEPERVMPTTWMYTNHPEWLLTPSSLPEGISYQSTWRLFNLANADALDWLKNKVNTMISTIGIDVYRQDFNMHPLYYWRTGEASDRKGINEIKHITNMYNFLDYLVSQHPSLIEDNCAAGGRRIDFEMLRRCLVLSRSDLFWDAVGEQCATSGLGRWVPYTGTGDVSLNQSTHRSGMGASFSIAYNANDPATWAPANSMLTEYWYVREPMVKGDFYPLSTFDTSNTIWFAYQWNYPEAGKAILQAWRRPSCTETSKTYKLRNLEPGAVYTINDLRGQGTYTLTGMELMTTGITLSNYAAGGSALVVVTK